MRRALRANPAKLLLSYGIVLLATLESSLSTPALEYALTAKYHVSRKPRIRNLDRGVPTIAHGDRNVLRLTDVRIARRARQ
jgi:hypothetical protein